MGEVNSRNCHVANLMLASQRYLLKNYLRNPADFWGPALIREITPSLNKLDFLPRQAHKSGVSETGQAKIYLNFNKESDIPWTS